MTPKDGVALLIDHHPVQFPNLTQPRADHGHQLVVSLAKIAKVFGVQDPDDPVVEQRGGYLLGALQDVFPVQKPINRTFINTWEDRRVAGTVKVTGRTAAALQ